MSKDLAKGVKTEPWTKWAAREIQSLRAEVDEIKSALAIRYSRGEPLPSADLKDTE